MGRATARPATDIIILAHNRLDHLVATIDALEARTPEPIRISVVDNASGPDVRNWLAANRHRLHRLILRPTNEHVPAFQHGIDATTSDPYIVTDPDIVVPDLEPSWLARLHGLMDAHPDFGLLGIGLDQRNRPDVLGPEIIDPSTVVDDEIVEGGVGTVMQMIRRDALVTPYRSDWRTCTDVHRAGWRVGWARDIRGVHLGWDDYRLHPTHLASKHNSYGFYREMELIGRPPTLSELALAGPIAALTRQAGVKDGAILELTWNGPVLGAAVPGAVCVERPEPGRLPFEAGAAGAVILIDPPPEHSAEMVREAARISTGIVVALATLDSFDARTAADLAPPGWSGEEATGPGDLPVSLAHMADEDPSLAAGLGPAAIEQRERWLAFFARSTFGAGRRRLWVWRPAVAGAEVQAVRFDSSVIRPWRPDGPAFAPPPRMGVLRRAWKRADFVERTRVHIAVRRRRIGEVRL